jgi:hypothetical protein
MGDRRFDVVFINWALHHFVLDSYRKTRAWQERILSAARGLLTARGRVSVLEDVYDGLIFTDLPGRLIYTATSIRMLGSLTRRMGANTGGCGVCFLSRRQWEGVFRRTMFDIVSYRDLDPIPRARLHRVLLHIGNVRWGHFVLKQDTPAAGERKGGD